jgi:hypothetical protein
MAMCEMRLTVDSSSPARPLLAAGGLQHLGHRAAAPPEPPPPVAASVCMVMARHRPRPRGDGLGAAGHRAPAPVSSARRCRSARAPTFHAHERQFTFLLLVRSCVRSFSASIFTMSCVKPLHLQPRIALRQVQAAAESTSAGG